MVAKKASTHAINYTNISGNEAKQLREFEKTVERERKTMKKYENIYRKYQKAKLINKFTLHFTVLLLHG